ncbi:MAG TPA: glycosyltransferase family 4 protein [Planctomycetota bacterium]
MKKLCYICEATQGGVRKHLRDLLRVFSQAQEGFEVHAILGDRGEPGFRDEMEQLAKAGNVRYTLVPQLRRALRPWRDAAAYSQMKELLRSIKPDIVHTHSAKAGFLGRYAAHNLDIERVIHTAHVFPFQWAGGVTGRVYLGLERQVARFSETLICVGESQRADAVARKLTDPAKLVVVRNGIELPEQTAASQRAAARATLGLPESALAVGMVGRLAPQKGIGALVKAAANVLRERADAVFFVVGGGPLEGSVRRRMAELGVPESRFRLLGHREDADKLYAAFDVVALSSLYEGLPYVLLEAMARGVPVVATDVLGSRDVVVEGETGFLARVKDSEHIAECIIRLLGDANLREQMGRAGRERVAREFSFEAFVAGHRSIYQQ